jgi:hypothetical protein
LTLSQLASLLNNWWQIQHGVRLAQVISEPDFIVLINDMVGVGEIMQVRQRFSMPYSFGSTQNSQNGSTTTSIRSGALDCTSISPESVRQPVHSSSSTMLDQGLPLNRTQSEQILHQKRVIE